MTLLRLCLRNLLYHWRGNLAVFLGVVVGTAVLTGALLVGDSLRGSLADLTLRRLGWIDNALVAPRFFREQLASEIEAGHAAPAILLQATAVSREGKTQHMARHVTVVGVDQRYWSGGPHEFAFPFASDKAQINRTLARALNWSTGQSISLRVQKP